MSLQNITHREKILKIAKEKRQSFYKGEAIRVMSLLNKIIEAKKLQDYNFKTLRENHLKPRNSGVL